MNDKEFKERLRGEQYTQAMGDLVAMGITNLVPPVLFKNAEAYDCLTDIPVWFVEHSRQHPEDAQLVFAANHRHNNRHFHQKVASGDTEAAKLVYYNGMRLEAHLRKFARATMQVIEKQATDRGLSSGELLIKQSFERMPVKLLAEQSVFMQQELVLTKEAAAMDSVMIDGRLHSLHNRYTTTPVVHKLARRLPDRDSGAILRVVLARHPEIRRDLTTGVLQKIGAVGVFEGRPELITQAVCGLAAIGEFGKLVQREAVKRACAAFPFQDNLTLFKLATRG